MQRLSSPRHHHVSSTISSSRIQQQPQQRCRGHRTDVAAAAAQQQQQRQHSTVTSSCDAADDQQQPTHRRGVLQGLLGTAAWTSLPQPAAAEPLTQPTQQPAAAASSNTCAQGSGCVSSAAASEAAAAAADASASASSTTTGSCRLQHSSAAAAARDPAINSGCATTQPARQQLAGLIPPRQVDLSVEVARAQAALQRCSSDFEKHRLLMALKETNSAAFIALLRQDLEGMLPLIYTPVVAEACLNWGLLLPRPLGLYVTPLDDPLQLVMRWPSQQVKVAVITDGERILGIGDLGAHGMGIPTGKCNVYAAAGTPPDWLLPITMDVGTDNAALRSDPLYVGLPTARLRGARYFDVMEGVVGALRQRFGQQVVVHWEDLAVGNAFEMLRRTQALGLPTFNDDVQCTAAVTLAALLGAAAIPGVLPLQSQTFCFFGAGQANLGVAQLLVRVLQQRGLSAAAARSRIWMVDSKGLITTDRTNLSPQKAEFAQDPARLTKVLRAGTSSSSGSSSSRRQQPSSAAVNQQLTSIVEAVQPTALIGAAAVSGAFGQPVLQALLKATRAAGGPGSRPVVLALSNPTDQAEVSFEDARKWTGGAAVYASGSPFPPITTAAGRTLRPAQANNCFVFAGLAQGILAAASSGAAAAEQQPPAVVVDERLLLVAAEAIAALVTQQEVEEECVLPRIRRLPEVTAAISAAVTRAVTL